MYPSVSRDKNYGFLCYCYYCYAHCHEPCILTNLSFLLKDRWQGCYPSGMYRKNRSGRGFDEHPGTPKKLESPALSE